MNRFKDWIPPKFDIYGWAYDEYWEKYGWRCQNSDNLSLGKNIDIGCFTYMNAKYGIEIGNNTQIGSSCSIYSIDTENGTSGEIVIGDGCLIGSHTIILPKVTIPPNSKIRARSLICNKKGIDWISDPLYSMDMAPLSKYLEA